MNSANIKETMDQINISEDMQKNIIKNLCRQTVKGKYQYKYKEKTFRKLLLTAAILLLVVCTVSIPVQAGIRYLVRQRMEDTPKEEMEAILTMQKEQMIPGDGFSRDYSKEEQARMAELYRAYQNGTFPKGELVMLEADEEIPEDILYYLKSTGCFYLPDRNLTDEELLQIIDFNYKRDYSLTLDPEVQAAKAEQEKEQEEIKRTVSGISESDAIAVAQNLMNSFYGVSTDGMEETIYLDNTRFDVPIYHITYDIRSNCYYYFSISTVDGTVMEFERSLVSWPHEFTLTETQAAAQIPGNYQAAQNLLEEYLGIHEDFTDVCCLYVAEEGCVVSWNLAYYFITDDKKVYKVDFCSAANEFLGYSQTTYEVYQQSRDRENVVSVAVSLEN